MIKAPLPTLLAVLLVSTPAAARTNSSDLDKAALLGGYETFTRRATPQSSLEQGSPLIHQGIVKAIESLSATWALPPAAVVLGE